MFNEANVRDSLYAIYYDFCNISDDNIMANVKLEDINCVLDYVMSDLNNYNENELKIVNNILIISRHMLTKLNEYQVISYPLYTKTINNYKDILNKYKTLR